MLEFLTNFLSSYLEQLKSIFSPSTDTIFSWILDEHSIEYKCPLNASIKVSDS